MKTILKIFYSHYSKNNINDWPWFRAKSMLLLSLFLVFLFIISILKSNDVSVNLDIVFENKIIMFLIIGGYLFLFDFAIPENKIKSFEIEIPILKKHGFKIIMLIWTVLFILSSFLLLKSAGKI